MPRLRRLTLRRPTLRRPESSASRSSVPRYQTQRNVLDSPPTQALTSRSSEHSADGEKGLIRSDRSFRLSDLLCLHGPSLPVEALSTGRIGQRQLRIRCRTQKDSGCSNRPKGRDVGEATSDESPALNSKKSKAKAKASSRSQPQSCSHGSHDQDGRQCDSLAEVEPGGGSNVGVTFPVLKVAAFGHFLYGPPKVLNMARLPRRAFRWSMRWPLARWPSVRWSSVRWRLYAFRPPEDNLPLSVQATCQILRSSN